MTASTERRPRVAILIVNGFRRKGRWAQYNLEQALRYPWIDMCLRQIERNSVGWDYEVFLFDNSHLKQHRALMHDHERVTVTPPGWLAALARQTARLPIRHVDRLTERSHPAALDHLAAHVPGDFDYIVTLDNDSFPVREDWLEVLIGACEEGAAISGVYRDEMAPEIAPFIHVSGLCMRPRELRALDVSFGRDARPEIEHNQDVGQRITYELSRQGRTIAPLERSNALNYHFLIGGIYGDVIYHHGAGSRRGKFWTSTDRENDDRVNAALREAAFGDLDSLIAVLRGQAPNELDIQPL
jgi:Glycosyl transferase family 2